MTLKKEGYRPRLIDQLIQSSLTAFGAVLIEGPKYCGKTWTALNHANSVVYLLDPARGYANKTIAQTNPSVLLAGDEPQLIDEWQEAPGIWDAVRFAVDQSARKGCFILTGSATVQINAPRHSGAGRIARVRQHTMTLFESGESSGEVSLAGLLESAANASGNSTNDAVDCDGSALYFDPFLVPPDFEALAYAATRGGWPQSITMPQESALQLPEQYLAALAESDIAGADNRSRDARKVANLLRALARNTATQVSNATLKWDITQGAGTISPPTLASYIAALNRVFVLEEIPGWAPDVRAKTRMRTSPKRFLADPSLAVAALGLTPQRLLLDPPTFGLVFESLCLRDLQAYAELIGARLYHYHDNSGLEVDAIIEMKDGSYAAVEIKLNEQDQNAAKTLNRFTSKMSKQELKLPILKLVVTGGGLAHARDDGIVVVPITCLRP